MQLPWRYLKHLPTGLLTGAKRFTSPGFRLWLRERTGGTAASIPDTHITVPDGRKIHIGPDLIYWSIYQGLEFEPETTSVFRALTPKGSCVIDAGANYGWFATLFGQLVGDEGRVFAFEPIPTTHARLTEHIEINGLSGQVTAEQAALGDEPGEATMHVFDDLSHARSSLSTLGRTDHQAVTAPIHTLDGYLLQHEIDHVELIKCDVEGAELAVLRGASRLLHSDNAPIVALEMNEETCAAMGYHTRDLRGQLASYGYDKFYRVAAIDRVEPITNDQQLAATDLMIACKDDRVERRLSRSSRSAAA